MSEKRIFRLLPWLLLLALYLFGVGTHIACGAHYADADLASELVLSDLLNREGRLLTDSWYYSSELRVVSPVPLYQLGLRLFSSWRLAQAFAAAIMLAVLAACFLYMAKPCGLCAGGLFTAAILCLPFTRVYAEFVAFGCYYAVFLSLIFLLLGLLLRMERRRGRPLRLILLAVLSLWGGMGGVRLLMNFVLPLGLALLWLTLSRARGAGTLREAAERCPRVTLAAAALSFCCIFAGYLLNTRVLSALYTFDSYSATAVLEPDAELALYQLTDALSFFGFREASRLISLRGLLSLGSVALLILALRAAGRQMTEGADPADCLPAAYGFFAVLSGVSINLITGNFGCQYYLPGLLMLIAALDRRIAAQRWPRALQGIACLALVGVFALNAAVYVREDVPKEASPAEQASAWLREQGYSAGYATFWNGAVMTMATDGALEIWTLEEPTYSDGWRSLQLNEYLQEKRHLREDPQGRVFVYLSPEEAANPPAWADGAHLLRSAGWGSVYGYESAAELKQGVDSTR